VVTREIGALEGERLNGVSEGFIGVHAEVLHVLPDHGVEGLLRDRDRHFLALLVGVGAATEWNGFAWGFPSPKGNFEF